MGSDQDLTGRRTVSNASPSVLRISLAVPEPTVEKCKQIVLKHRCKVSLMPSWLRLLAQSTPTQLHNLLSTAFTLFNSSATSRHLAHDSVNVKKNRYQDVVPFDAFRVKLIKQTSDGSDYINASYISGHRGYIATQGPLPGTISSFWQMVYEQSTSLILMLSSTEERGRLKCEKYWPDLYETITLSDTTIECIEENFVLDSDSVIKRVVVVKMGSREKRVTFIQYLGWPDFQVCDSKFVLKLINYVNQLRDQLEDDLSGRIANISLASHTQIPLANQMVVHCSAGCGRTGTFCVIDTVTALLASKDYTDGDDLIIECITRMRKQRTFMVQTFEQFVFCYEAVLEWIAARDNEICVID